MFSVRLKVDEDGPHQEGRSTQKLYRSYAYRPICLLDGAGKLFERKLAERFSKHLSQVGPDLSEGQFSFRQARSMVDVIFRICSLSTRVVSQGKVALAVSLDTVNAFNVQNEGKSVTTENYIKNRKRRQFL